MSHKPYAKNMAHLSVFRDGLTKKKQKGHSIVTHDAHIHDLSLVSLELELYRKDEQKMQASHRACKVYPEKRFFSCLNKKPRTKQLAYSFL